MGNGNIPALSSALLEGSTGLTHEKGQKFLFPFSSIKISLVLSTVKTAQGNKN